MKKLFLVLLFAVSGSLLMAQGPCQVSFGYQTDPSGNLYLSGYAWNNDSTAINVTAWTWTVSGGGSMQTYTTQYPVFAVASNSVYAICLTINTSTGCTSTYCDSVIINQTGCNLYLDLAVTPATDMQSLDGAIDLTVTNGIAPFVYMWSNGSASEDATGLSYGNYSITVTDANGCTAASSAYVYTMDSIPNGCQFWMTYSTTPESTTGALDGAVDVTAYGGSVPYAFNWDNGATTEDLTGVAAGWYTVSAFDAQGCATTMTVYVPLYDDSSNVVIDTLYTNPIDTCFNFIIDSVFVYDIVMPDSNTVVITWAFVGGGAVGYLTETYTVGPNGNYVVTISVNCGSKGITTYSAVVNINYAILMNATQISWTATTEFYPNPVQDVLNVNVSGIDTPSVIIMDASGRVVFAGRFNDKDFQVDTRSLQQGMYFIRIADAQGNSITEKFIK